MLEKLYRNSAFVLIMSILIIPAVLSGQNSEDEVSLIQYADSVYLEERPEIVHEKMSPWNFSTTMGSSFSFFPGYGSSTNMFVAPHLDFSATNRLSFHGGVIASQNFPMFNSVGGETGNYQSFINLSMFVAASYQLIKDFVV